MRGARLEVRDLRHRFSDGTWGLDGIDLHLEPGTLTVLSGPNGCGKTLLLKHLVGLEEPTEGHVLLDGLPAGEDWNASRDRIGLVFQDADNQLIEATAGEDAAFGPRQHGLDRKKSLERAREVLEQCGLAHKFDSLCATLSGGEKRRLTVAGTLALEAQVILLDEPFTGLDLEGTRRLLEILLGLKDQGCTLLVVTHELEKCLAHADQLVLMAKGQILGCGTPEELWDRIPEAGVHRPAVNVQDRRLLTWLGR